MNCIFFTTAKYLFIENNISIGIAVIVKKKNEFIRQRT